MKVSRGVASEKAWTGAASAIAHDIKTPLATLQVAVDTLLTPGVGTSRRRFLGSVVRRQVSRLDSMVTELIESLRLTSGDLQLDLVPYDLNQLVAEACADFRLLDPDRQFLFAAPNQDLVLPVDVDKLRRIVDNLLSNAATHSATTAPVRVSVQLHEAEEMVVLRVSDEGAGVPESERDRIAEPFVSLNPAARGQGLGLFSVRLIAGAHGGRVWTETTPQSFSVCVGLPLSVEESSQG